MQTNKSKTIGNDHPNGFKCQNCSKPVGVGEFIGTKNRNHCPYCLWSKHVDKSPGDRLEDCKGGMMPIGLTYKQEGYDKYGTKKQGELMLIHKCKKCGHVSINRIAGDDNNKKILNLLSPEAMTPSENQNLNGKGIRVLDQTDSQQVNIQLFGRTS